jgi:hypothetical protein
VRVLSFEQAFARLTQDEQLVLIALCRERQRHDRAAAVIGGSVRNLAYLVPAARQHFADVLDRYDLL